MKKAIYAGTFDPITNGHMHILQKSLQIFDEVTIYILNSSSKKSMFSIKERLSFIKKATKNIFGVKVAFFSGLLVDLLKNTKTSFVIRGLRNFTDFAYESELNSINKSLYKNFDSIYFLSDLKYSFISSSMIRELIKYKKEYKHLIPFEI